MLWVAIHFPHLPPQALAPIAAWACQFTPKVSLEPPQELLLEVGGSLRLFGGLESFKRRFGKELRELQYAFSFATASTARAALWLARGEGGSLEALPVEVTRFDVEFLRSIGVGSVGELLALPRAELGQRCGARMLAELDWTLGTAREPRTFFSPPPRFAAKLELAAAVEHAEALAFGAQRLLAQLAGLLAARHEGIRSFKLFLDGDRSTVLEIGLASATRDAARMARVLRERLGGLSLTEPVSALRLEAGDFVPLQGSSRGMFGDAAGDAEDWAQLLERLRARLGHSAVHGLAAHPDHRPEHAWRRIEPGEWDPREAVAPGPRPLWLLPAAKKIDENGFSLVVGPERIESGWWDGDDARRDYFIARLANGELAWVYREAGRSSPSWYLHGLFA